MRCTDLADCTSYHLHQPLEILGPTFRAWLPIRSTDDRKRKCNFKSVYAKIFFSKESLLNVWLVWKHTDVKIKIDAGEKFGLCNINSHHGTGLRCRGKMRTTAWSFLRTISLIILISAPLSVLTSHCSADTWRGPRWRGWLRSHQRLIGSRGDLYLI